MNYITKLLIGKQRVKNVFSHYSFALLILFFSSLNAYAQEWIGGTGNWDDPTNWDTGVVPGNGDAVTINNGGTVIVNVPQAVFSLTLEDGALAGPEDLSVEEFLWYGGDIQGLGVFEVTDYMEIDAFNPISLDGRTLLLVGQCFWLSGDLDILSSGTFQVADGALFSAEHGSSQTIGDSGGRFLLEAGGIFDISSNTTINGKLEVQSGSINVLGNNLTIAGATSHTLNECSISISNSRKFILAGGTISMENNSSSSGNGTLEINGGTLNINSNTTFTSKVNLISGEIGGSSNINFNAAFNWEGGQISSSGTSSFTSLHFNTSNGKELNYGTLQLTSSGNWSDGNITLGNGASFQTATGSNFTISHSGAQGISSTGSGGVVFGGVVSKTGNSITQINCDLTVTVSGSLKINAGTFQTTSGSVGAYNSGIRVSAGAIYDVNGGVHDLLNGSIYGEGNFVVSGGTVICAPGTKLITSLSISSGSMTNNSNIFPLAFDMTGGSLFCNGDVSVGNYMNWASGTISGSGTITVNGYSDWTTGTRNLDGATIMLEGDTDWAGGDFVFSNGAKIQATATTTLIITHTSVHSATGSGTFQVDGMFEIFELNSTTNISIDFVHNGVAMGNGSVTFGSLTNNGTVAPGFSIGQLTVNDFNNLNGVLEMEISGTGARGTTYDILDITGVGEFSGILDVVLLGGFVPNIGAAFHIIDCANCSGTFSTINIPVLPTDREWAFDYSNGLTITVEQLLPVELVNFSARAEGPEILLNWSTASETNNKGYSIEKRSAANDWETIGFVMGVGNSSQTSYYSFVDVAPQNGVNYYRLKQMDLNGDHSYSAVRSAQFDKQVGEMVSIFPNPVSGDSFKIRINTDLGSEGTISIFSQNGRKVFSQNIGHSAAKDSIDMSGLGLMAGLYTVTFQTENESNKVKLVVK